MLQYTKIKIIEEESPRRAEYEMNDFIDHCRNNEMNIHDIQSHVSCDAKGNYCYTFVIRYESYH